MRHFRLVKNKPGVLVEVDPKTGKDLNGGQEVSGSLSEAQMEFRPTAKAAQRTSLVEAFKAMGFTEAEAKIAAEI
jgi:hypothetical protein